MNGVEFGNLNRVYRYNKGRSGYKDPREFYTDLLIFGHQKLIKDPINDQILMVKRLRYLAGKPIERRKAVSIDLANSPIESISGISEALNSDVDTYDLCAILIKYAIDSEANVKYGGKRKKNAIYS